MTLRRRASLVVPLISHYYSQECRRTYYRAWTRDWHSRNPTARFPFTVRHRAHRCNARISHALKETSMPRIPDGDDRSLVTNLSATFKLSYNRVPNKFLISLYYSCELDKHHNIAIVQLRNVKKIECHKTVSFVCSLIERRLMMNRITLCLYRQKVWNCVYVIRRCRYVIAWMTTLSTVDKTAAFFTI